MSRGEVFKNGAIVAGRYTIVRVLGAGGMGSIYEAENRTTGRPVALKIPWKRYAEDEVYRRRFLREARAATALSHPNVIDILDVAEHEGELPVLVMELLHGSTLASSITANGRLTLGEAASHLVPVLDAIAIAHKIGIIHRDLKPENIFLADQPDGGMIPKLLDFGIVKLAPGATGAEPSGTATGTVLGTPYYMAPEQVGGVRDLDGRVDVWAGGAVTFECLSGQRPFPGENFGQIFAAILQTEAPRLDTLVPTLPEPVVAAVRHALTRDRDQRAATVDALVAALEPFVYRNVRRTRTANASLAPRLEVRDPDTGESADTIAAGDTAAGPGESLAEAADADTRKLGPSEAPPADEGALEGALTDSPPPAEGRPPRRLWPAATAAALVGAALAAAIVMGGGKPAPSPASDATAAVPRAVPSIAASAASTARPVDPAGSSATAIVSATSAPSAAPAASAAVSAPRAPASDAPIRRPASSAATSARPPVTTAAPTAPGGLLRDPSY